MNQWIGGTLAGFGLMGYFWAWMAGRAYGLKEAGKIRDKILNR